MVELLRERDTPLRVVDPTLQAGEADSLQAAAVKLCGEPARIHDRATIGHGVIVFDLDLPGFPIELDASEGSISWQRRCRDSLPVKVVVVSIPGFAGFLHVETAGAKSAGFGYRRPGVRRRARDSGRDARRVHRA